MTVVARVIMGFGTRQLPSVTAIVQNPPTLIPNITRPASITAKFEASAEVMLEATSSPVNPSIRIRRSTFPAPIVMSGAANVATKPGIVTMSPAVPSETCSPAEIWVNKPTGRNSEVTKTSPTIYDLSHGNSTRACRQSGSKSFGSWTSQSEKRVAYSGSTSWTKGRD
jgi:hypothetical protein